MNKFIYLYSLLDIVPTASILQIKSAYRTKSKDLHPDKGGNPKDFSRLNVAYKTLLDPILRAKYDNCGICDIDVSVEEKTIRLAIDKITQVLNEILSGCISDIQKMESIDISEEITQISQRVISTCEGSRKILNTNIENLNQLKKRMLFTGKGDNILFRIVNLKIKETKESIANNNHEIFIAKKVIEIISNYKFEII